MSDVERRPEAEEEYGAHLQRSENVWNRWSDWYKMSEEDFESIRNDLITNLGLEDGDRVLEIGCGPGVNFGTIRDAIGEGGSLVAIDYSPKMVQKAKERVEKHEWENIEVVRAEATTADLGGPYDAAIATLALSVLPDIERALWNIHSALEPGAPLGVVDIQEFQSGRRRVFNPLVTWFLRWYANWNPDENVRVAITEVFGEHELIEMFMLGTVYMLKAKRAAP